MCILYNGSRSYCWLKTRLVRLSVIGWFRAVLMVHCSRRKKTNFHVCTYHDRSIRSCCRIWDTFRVASLFLLYDSSSFIFFFHSFRGFLKFFIFLVKFVWNKWRKESKNKKIRFIRKKKKWTGCSYCCSCRSIGRIMFHTCYISHSGFLFLFPLMVHRPRFSVHLNPL